MEHVALLIETLLWVGLVVWIVSKFGKSIADILNALHKRIEAGGSVKAGPFELGEGLKPQALQDQIEKAKSEVKELITEDQSSVSTSVAMSAALSKYYEVEDLALRAIQLEFGVKINRQVTAGTDRGFDGAFVKDGILNIIEVKAISRLRRGFLQNAIEQISSSVARYGWKNVRIIAVVVTDLEAARVQEFAKQELEDSAYPTELRVYQLEQLRQQFGLTQENG